MTYDSGTSGYHHCAVERHQFTAGWGPDARSGLDRFRRGLCCSVAYVFALTAPAVAEVQMVGQDARNVVFDYPSLQFDYWNEEGKSIRADLSAIQYIDPVKLLKWVDTKPESHPVWPSIHAMAGSYQDAEAIKWAAMDSGFQPACDTSLSNKYGIVNPGGDFGYRYEVDCIYGEPLWEGAPNGWVFDVQQGTDSGSGSKLFGHCEWVRSRQLVANVDNSHVYSYPWSGTSRKSDVWHNRYACGSFLDDPISVLIAEYNSTGPDFPLIGGYIYTNAVSRIFTYMNAHDDYSVTDPPDIFVTIDLDVEPCIPTHVGDCTGAPTDPTDPTDPGGGGGGGGDGGGDDGSGGTGGGTGGSDGGTGGDDGSGGTGGTGGGTGGSGGGSGDGEYTLNLPAYGGENFAGVDDLETGEVDVSTISQGSSWLPSDCPANPSFTALGKTYEMDLTHVCTGASMMSYVVIAGAFMSALMIVIGGTRSA